MTVLYERALPDGVFVFFHRGDDGQLRVAFDPGQCTRQRLTDLLQLVLADPEMVQPLDTEEAGQ
jgi:hypothetical protein